MGDEALGVVSTYFYSAVLDTPANRVFSAAYTKATGRIPSIYSSYPYTAARWIVEGMKAVGGDVENKERFLAALKSVDIQDDVRGPIKVDPYGNPIENMYVRKVERVGGRLQNTVIHTYPTVSQFWTYRPEDFLKNPVYDRDKFPGCRYCE
jgi:branched-chain amino acid transport system substrate-binding protein